VENPLGYSLRSLLLEGEEPCPLILANSFLNHPELFTKIAAAIFKKTITYFNSGSFYPPGEPILPHLLRYRVLAVKDHSFAPCALYLWQPRLVNNPNKLTWFLLPLFVEKMAFLLL
jgi:hypothetical protein